MYGIHKQNTDFLNGKTWQKRAFIWLEPAGITIIYMCNNVFQDDIQSLVELTI